MVDCRWFHEAVNDKVASGEWSRAEALRVRNLMAALLHPKCPPGVRAELARQVNRSVGKQVAS